MAKKAKLQVRIRYEEKFTLGGETYEAFIFESKTPDEKEYGLDTAFRLRDTETEKGALIHYTALTKIRDLMKWGDDVEIFFK